MDNYLNTLIPYTQNKIANIEYTPAATVNAPDEDCLEVHIVSAGNNSDTYYRLGDPNYYTWINTSPNQNFQGQNGYRIVYDVWLSEAVSGVGGFTLGNQSSAYYAANFAPDLSQVAYGQWYTVDEQFVDSSNAGLNVEQVGPSFRTSTAVDTIVYYRNIRILNANGEVVFVVYNSFEKRVTDQEWIMRCEGSNVTSSNYIQCYFRKNIQMMTNSYRELNYQTQLRQNVLL